LARRANFEKSSLLFVTNSFENSGNKDREHAKLVPGAAQVDQATNAIPPTRGLAIDNSIPVKTITEAAK
jgi:hypothetical protein